MTRPLRTVSEMWRHQKGIRRIGDLGDDDTSDDTSTDAGDFTSDTATAYTSTGGDDTSTDDGSTGGYVDTGPDAGGYRSGEHPRFLLGHDPDTGGAVGGRRWSLATAGGWCGHGTGGAAGAAVRRGRACSATRWSRRRWRRRRPGHEEAEEEPRTSSTPERGAPAALAMGCACKGSTGSPSTIGAMLARRGRFHDPRQLASAHGIPATKACGCESSACGCVPATPASIGAMLARRGRFHDPRHLKKTKRSPVATLGTSTGCGTVPVLPSTIGGMFSRAARFKGPTHIRGVRGLGYQTVEDVADEKLRINALLATISGAWNACWDGSSTESDGPATFRRSELVAGPVERLCVDRLRDKRSGRAPLAG